MRSEEAELLAIKHALHGASAPSSMLCTAKAAVKWGVPATHRLLSVTVEDSSDLILDFNRDTTSSDFWHLQHAKRKPNAVHRSELQYTQPVDLLRHPW